MYTSFKLTSDSSELWAVLYKTKQIFLLQHNISFSQELEISELFLSKVGDMGHKSNCRRRQLNAYYYSCCLVYVLFLFLLMLACKHLCHLCLFHFHFNGIIGMRLNTTQYTRTFLALNPVR